MRKIILLTVFCLLTVYAKPVESISIKERLRQAREREAQKNLKPALTQNPEPSQNSAAQEPATPTQETPQSTVSRPTGKRCASSQCGSVEPSTYNPVDQPYQEATPIGTVGDDGTLRGEIILNNVYNTPIKKNLSEILNNTSLPAAAYNDGEYTSYFNNGRVIYRRYTMKDRVLQGEFQEYYINGALKRELYFKNGYVLKELTYRPATWPGER